MDNSPQLVLALLRQLVNVVGVSQSDITPTAYAQMDYFINFAILKDRSSGVTRCDRRLTLRCADSAFIYHTPH